MLPQLKAFQYPLIKENITFYTKNYPPDNYIVNDAIRSCRYELGLNSWLSYLAKQLGFDEYDYEQVWQVNKIGNYFAFNINTSDEFINTYQKAFDNIANQRLRIKEYYEFPLAEY